MFSDHLKQPDGGSHKTMFGIVAGFVFVCQVIALVVIVEGQVEKAHQRQAQYGLTQAAVADCSRNYRGAARSQCIAQADAGHDSSLPLNSLPEALTLSQAVQNTDAGPSEVHVVNLTKATFARR